jgi:CRISPR-associated endoribonuclease Cas6
MLEVLEPLKLPPFKGSTLRGGFGTAFRQAVCVTHQKNCTQCLLLHNCVYSYVFETPIPDKSKVLTKYPNAPHPFVFDPPLEDRTEYEPGEILELGLTIFGKSIEHLPYFIWAFEVLGKKGIGVKRGRFHILSVTQGNRVIYRDKKLRYEIRRESWEDLLSNTNSPGNEIKFEFLTPTRMLYRGKLVKVPEFHHLIRNLLRRINLMTHFHQDFIFDADVKKLIRESEKVKIKKHSIKQGFIKRYSSRQKQKISMFGFTGEIIYEGNFEPFWIYLKLGEILHIGKATSFGFGKYKMEVLDG